MCAEGVCPGFSYQSSFTDKEMQQQSGEHTHTIFTLLKCLHMHVLQGTVTIMPFIFLIIKHIKNLLKLSGRVSINSFISFNSALTLSRH